MESLAHLVTESLGRHGFKPAFDHRRLQWSNWFPCQDSFSLVLAPCKPGLFALGEEVIATGELVPLCGPSEPRSRLPERSEGSFGEGKRMLALFQISEAIDLGMSLGRLFLSGNPARKRFASGRCFARYVVIEDPTQRRTALAALQRWMASSTEALTPGNQVATESHVAPDAPVQRAERSSIGFLSGNGLCNAGSVSGNGSDNAGFVSGHDFSRAANPASTAALAAASADPADASAGPESSNKQAQIGPPSPIPSGF
jgi:hypothetical protein